MASLLQLYGRRVWVVVERRHVTGVQAASGLAETTEGWLLACDDVPDMFLVNLDGQVLAQHAISAAPPVLVEGRVPKKHKRDFESIADYRQGKDTHFWVIGSGSKLPQRSYIVQGSWQGGPKNLKEVQAEPLYKHLMKVSGISEESLNIEGAAVFDKRVILLNRGTNQTFVMDQAAFGRFLDSGCAGAAPDAQVHSYDLPDINGVQLGFSGSCTDLRRNRIYFSASAEATDNWIDDGQVLGSFIGWIVRPTAADGGEMHLVPVVDEHAEFLPLKIEAIGLLPAVDSRVRMLALTDSDGGESEMLVLEMQTW